MLNLQMKRRYMVKNLLTILFAVGMAMAVQTASAKADPIIEVNSIDFNQISINYYNGSLHITGASGLTVTVYNIVGQKVYEAKIDGNDKRIDLSLPANCYIVKVGTVARKISVKR